MTIAQNVSWYQSWSWSQIHQLQIAQEEQESIMNQQIVELQFPAFVLAALPFKQNEFLVKEGKKISFEIKKLGNGCWSEPFQCSL